MPTSIGGIQFGGVFGPLLEYIGLAVHDGTLHGLWADRRDAGPDFEAYYASASFLSVVGDNVLTITGDDEDIATNDTITVSRSTINSNYLEVTVGPNRQFMGLMASVNRIEIEGGAGNDTITIDADIDVDVRILGGVGGDTVTLRGKGASSLGKFEFFGEAGDDIFRIDYTNGDPLPMAGLDFNFIGGEGTDDVKVIELGGLERTGWFVNLSTDARDLVTGGRLDSSADPDDQITLRAAIQVANLASTKTYIFVPTGTYLLSISGSGEDNEGDFEITKNVAIIGTGAGEAIIDASWIPDRLFDVKNMGILKLSRVTLTLGTAITGTMDGGAIRVQNGGELDLAASAVVSNSVVGSGQAGGIYFESSGRGSITDSVITVNQSFGQTAGVYLQGATSEQDPGRVEVTRSIIAKNNAAAGSTFPDVFAGTNRTFTSGGKNRLGNWASGFGTAFGDSVGTPHYIVTRVADTFTGNGEAAFMSLRDAIHAANIVGSPYDEEIWVPAWKFVLTRERSGQTTDIDAAYGDLDIEQTLTIRGINGSTNVAWRVGARVDAVFDLLGDYDGDGINSADNGAVESNDYIIWYNSQGSTTDLRADGNDDGVVNQADHDIWYSNFGNTLTLDGVTVS